MKPKAFVLDVLIPEIAGFAGILYGTHAGRRTVIASILNFPGLVPVATLGDRQDSLPTLVSGNGDDDWKLVDGDASVPVTILRWSSDFAARHQGLIDTPELAHKSCGIVGTSSIGLPIALHLARAGVRVTLFDDERVALENVIRSAFEVGQVGMHKVFAAAELATAANPRATIVCLPRKWSPSDGVSQDFLDPVDLIVNAASNSTGFALAERYHRKTPLLFPGVHAGAASGELFVSHGVANPDSPCFTCYRGSVGASIDSGRRWNYSSADHELEAEPGLGPDIGHVVSVTAAIALNLLAGKAERVLDRERQLLLVSNRRGALFEESYSSRWIRVKRLPDCPNHAPRESVDPGELSQLMSSIPTG